MLTPADFVSPNVIDEATCFLTAQLQSRQIEDVLARILEGSYLKSRAAALGSQIRRQQLISSNETSGC
jgi:hypothetical protein